MLRRCISSVARIGGASGAVMWPASPSPGRVRLSPSTGGFVLLNRRSMESSSQPEQQPSDDPQQGRVYPTEKQNKGTFKVLLNAVQRGTPSNMAAVDR